MEPGLSLIIVNCFKWVFGYHFTPGIFLSSKSLSFLSVICCQHYQGPGTIISYCQLLGSCPSSKFIALAKASSSKVVLSSKSIQIVQPAGKQQPVFSYFHSLLIPDIRLPSAPDASQQWQFILVSDPAQGTRQLWAASRSPRSMLLWALEGLGKHLEALERTNLKQIDRGVWRGDLVSFPTTLE